MKSTSDDNILEQFEAVKTSRSEHFMLIDDLAFLAFNKKYEFSGVKLLKNQILSVRIPFAEMQCYFLSRSIELKLKQMEAAGLIDFYKLQYVETKYLELIEEDEEPKVFTLDQLAIGFEAFLLFIGVAAIVFAFELLWFSLEKIAVLVAVYRVLMFQY